MNGIRLLRGSLQCGTYSWWRVTYSLLATEQENSAALSRPVSPTHRQSEKSKQPATSVESATEFVTRRHRRRNHHSMDRYPDIFRCYITDLVTGVWCLVSSASATWSVLGLIASGGLFDYYKQQSTPCFIPSLTEISSFSFVNDGMRGKRWPQSIRGYSGLI